MRSGCKALASTSLALRMPLRAARFFLAGAYTGQCTMVSAAINYSASHEWMAPASSQAASSEQAAGGEACCALLLRQH